VRDTRKRVDDLHVHRVTVSEGVFSVGDDVVLQVDMQRRAAILG